MDNSLTVVEQKTVELYGDDLLAVRAADGHVYVSLRHMCEALGLARQGQVRRVRDNEILAEGYQGVTFCYHLLQPGGGRSRLRTTVTIALDKKGGGNEYAAVGRKEFAGRVVPEVWHYWLQVVARFEMSLPPLDPVDAQRG